MNAEKPKSLQYPTILNTVGDRLRARRLDLGMLQKDVAAIIGVTVDTICYWENNRVRPSAAFNPKIRNFIAKQPTFEVNANERKTLLGSRARQPVIEQLTFEKGTVAKAKLSHWSAAPRQ